MDKYKQIVCKGFILGDDKNDIKFHYSNRRDRYCNSCVNKKLLGKRFIDRSRIRIIPNKIIKSYYNSCQKFEFFTRKI